MEITLFAALSADGFIARHEHEFTKTWTSKDDVRWFAQKTKEIGICIMGRTTYETKGRPLLGRATIVLSKSGKPIAEAEVIEPSESGSIFVTNSSPEEIVAALASRGVTKIAICGGSTIYHQFLHLGLVNSLFLTIEPILFGTGISLANRELNTKLRLIQLHPLSENTIVLEYQVELQSTTD